MAEMFLLHYTTYNSVIDILESGFMLPSSETQNRNENPYDRFLPYIYFTTCPKARVKDIQPYAFVFPAKILRDRCFYTNERHSADYFDNSTYYGKDTSMKKINKALTELYIQSTFGEEYFNWDRRDALFTTFQEVLFKKSVSLDDAVFLIVPYYMSDVEKKTVDDIKKKYPDLKTIVKRIYLSTSKFNQLIKY